MKQISFVVCTGTFKDNELKDKQNHISPPTGTMERLKYMQLVDYTSPRSKRINWA